MIGTATVLSKEGKTIVSDDDLGLELAVDRGFLPYRITHRLMPYILIHLQIRWIAGETRLV